MLMSLHEGARRISRNLMSMQPVFGSGTVTRQVIAVHRPLIEVRTGHEGPQVLRCARTVRRGFTVYLRLSE